MWDSTVERTSAGNRALRMNHWLMVSKLFQVQYNCLYVVTHVVKFTL
jgi:hypothetical protein